MKKYRLLALIVTVSILLLNPGPVKAHSGLPFLRINNKFTTTNPEYNQFTNPQVGQDVALDIFKPGQTIHFEVDKAGLGLSEETISLVSFRWHLKGSKEYKFGSKTEYVFENPGKYFIILDSKSPNAPDYVLFDSVEITVASPQVVKKNDSSMLLVLGVISLISSSLILLLIRKK